MDTVFLVGALALIIAFVLSLLLKEIPLRTMSGQDARRAAEVSAAPAPPLDPAGATAAVVPDNVPDNVADVAAEEAEGGRHEASGAVPEDGHGRHERGSHEATTGS